MIHTTLITKCYVFIDKDGRGLWTVFGKKVPAFCNVGVRLHGMHGIASSYLFHYIKSLHYATVWLVVCMCVCISVQRAQVFIVYSAAAGSELNQAISWFRIEPGHSIGWFRIEPGHSSSCCSSYGIGWFRIDFNPPNL